MSGSTMFSIAYGLRCDSSEDPLFIRMEKVVVATTQAILPTQFLVVSFLLAYVRDKSSGSSSLECTSSVEASSCLDAWWLLQEVDQAFG
jgi:hypothetical protein